MHTTPRNCTQHQAIVRFQSTTTPNSVRGLPHLSVPDAHHRTHHPARTHYAEPSPSGAALSLKQTSLVPLTPPNNLLGTFVTDDYDASA
jgi:hypothetical protein